MTPELEYLAWSVVLLIVVIALQAVSGIISRGFMVALGNQDDVGPNTLLWGRRLEKVLRNFLETYPIFVGLALALAVTKLGTEATATGAMIWFWARVAYVFAVLSGLPFIRTVVWAVSLVGLVMMLLPLL